MKSPVRNLDHCRGLGASRRRQPGGVIRRLNDPAASFFSREEQHEEHKANCGSGMARTFPHRQIAPIACHDAPDQRKDSEKPQRNPQPA